MNTRIRSTLIAAVLIATAPAAIAQRRPSGQGGGGEPADLARQLSNPVASLISVPFQLNWELGSAGGDPRTVINIQPVMPIPLNRNWNLIARVIAPVISQPPVFDGGETEFGLGDVTVSGFITPKRPGSLIWGIGPVLGLPMTTNPVIGSGKWSAGPTALALVEPDAWTIGALVTQLWSYAGESDRSDVNLTELQPFIAYHAPRSITLTLNSEAVANWSAADGDEWSVPIHLMITKVVSIGGRPTSVQLGGGYFVESPDGGPDWKVRSALTLLFPAMK